MKVDKLYQKETPTQVFSCEYCELFKNSFFIDKKLAAFGCSHQLKIFWERSASKFQGQQAAKFKYDGLYSATKTNPPSLFLQMFRTATFENNFFFFGGGAAF